MLRIGVSETYVDAFCGRVPKSVLAKHYTDFSPEKLVGEIYEKSDIRILGLWPTLGKAFYVEKTSCNSMLMRRPKWLSGWGKGKNHFEGSLIIDIPDIKVVEANFNSKLVLFAVGTSPRHATVVSSEGSDVAIGDKRGDDLEWRIFYDSTTIPDFIPIDKARDFMAGIAAISSGSASVYNAGTVFVASGKRPSKGNAPLLLDYEMAKKIEEAKKKK